MAIQKIEQQFSYDLREIDPVSTPTSREIGALMDEYCEGAASRCAKTGRCVLGAVSSVHNDSVNVSNWVVKLERPETLW